MSKRELKRLPVKAQVYVGIVCVAAILTLAHLAQEYPLRLNWNTVLLTLLGALSAARTIKIGERVHLGASHPFMFGTLLLEGPLAACVVAILSIVSASTGALRRKTMQTYQVFFNFGAMILCTQGSWLTYEHGIALTGDHSNLEAAVLPVLAASMTFFVLNSWMVAIAVGLVTNGSIVRAWYDNAVWSVPSFLAGGVIGLLIAHFVRQVGTVSLVLSLPFCYLIYYSYRLYMDRLDEKKQRIDVVERLNTELESKVRDRTDELMSLNQRLQESNEKLAAASRLKSEFLANMSHELRTPLNAILGFSELLSQDAAGALNEKQADFIGEIHSSGRNLMALINDILDLAKIEAGKMRMHLEECNPATVVHEATSMVRVLALNKSVELDVEEGEGVGTIYADPARFRQILWNLLSNAIKFTPSGGRVWVTVDAVDCAVSIGVHDTGIGIARSEITKLFGEFYQVDGSYTRQHGGTGLGLALVKKFIDLHGGHIEVESEVDRGSHFCVTLPARVPVEAREKSAATSAVFVSPFHDTDNPEDTVVAPSIESIGAST